MNKIYKVVWSKVRNCYIVVSEIAKNVISGGVKSAKIGAAPIVKGMALGALMAFVITGNAWATTPDASAELKAGTWTGLVVNSDNGSMVDASALDKGAIAIGDSSIATGNSTIAIGELATADGGSAIAVGSVSEAEDGGVAIGTWTIAGVDAVAIGSIAEAKYDYGVAIGNNSEAGSKSVAIGYGSDASAGSIAIGFSSRGYGGGVSIGNHSYAYVNAVAIGEESVADFADTVSFGHEIGDTYYQFDEKWTYDDNHYRRLVKVADGIDDHDVATVGQLKLKADKATSLAGYGITDAYTKTEADGIYATRGQLDVVEARVAARITEGETIYGGKIYNLEANKADKADTLAGYGITDAYTKTEADGIYATHGQLDVLEAEVAARITQGETYYSGKIHNLEANKADKAITLAGYGITDAYTKGEVDSVIAGAENRIIEASRVADSTLESKVTTVEGEIYVLQTTVRNQATAIADKVDAGITTDNTGLAIGSSASAGVYSTAVGYGAKANDEWSVAVGYKASASGDHTIAIGDNAIADGGQGFAPANIALGLHAVSTGEQAMALGVYANAYGADSVAIGSSSVAVDGNTVSFGHKAGDKYGQNKEATFSDDLYRRLTNVADGVNAHDVATVGQLNNAVSGKADVSYIDDQVASITSVYEAADVALNERVSVNEGAISDLQGAVDGNTENINVLNTKVSDSLESITGIDGRVSVNEGAISDLQGAVDGNTENINVLNTKVSDSLESITDINGKVANVQNILSNKADLDYVNSGIANVTSAYEAADSALRTEVNTKMAGKADKATTLAGYGITDAYNKTEIDNMISNSVGGAPVDAYTKTEVDAKLRDFSVIGESSTSIKKQESSFIGSMVADDVDDPSKAAMTHIGFDQDIEDEGVFGINSFVKDGQNKTFRDQTATEIHDAVYLSTSDMDGDAAQINRTVKTLGSTVSSITSGAKSSVLRQTVDGWEFTVNGESVSIRGNDVVVGENSFKDVATKVGVIQTDYLKGSDKTELIDAIENKANRADTLAGYGIIDAYTQEQVDNLIDSVSGGSSKVTAGNTNFGGGNLAAGEDSNASGSMSTAIGYGASSGQDSTAVGYRTDALASHSVAVGNQTRAYDTGAIAVGYTASAYSKNSIAIGSYTEEDSNGNLSTNDTTAVGENSIAIGGVSRANAINGIAFGAFAHVSDHAPNGIAIGAHSDVQDAYNVALGAYSVSDSDYSIALGAYSVTDHDNSVALGAYSVTNKDNSVSLGFRKSDGTLYTRTIQYVTAGVEDTDAVNVSQLKTKADKATNLAGYGIDDAYTKSEVDDLLSNSAGGTSVDAYTKTEVDTKLAGKVDVGMVAGSSAVAIGDSSQASGAYSVAIGLDSFSDNDYSIALGGHANATGLSSLSIGQAANSQGEWAIAIGAEANAYGEDSIAMGCNSQASGEWASIAIGCDSIATGDRSISLGRESDARGDWSIAIGEHANAYGKRSIAIGENASATHKNSVAIGRDSVTYADDTVSFGHNIGDKYGENNERVHDDNHYRRLTNIADGIDARDAVTVGQLEAKIADATSGLLTDTNLTAKADRTYVDSEIGNVTNAYKAADKSLETKLTNAYKSADTALETKLTNAYKSADTALETKLTNAYKSADTALETKLTNAYKSADTALETKITNAYKSADTALGNRITANEKSISALKTSISEIEVGGGTAYKAADTALESKVTKAYQAADKSLETKVTNAYKAADKTLETNVTKAYKAADTALESKVTKAYQAADKSLETKVTNAYKAADKTLETNVTKAYKAADTALESKVTKAYQAADKALEAKIANVTKADKELESKVTKAYQAADKSLETKVTNAYKAADKTLETNITKAYKSADTALESKVTKAYQAADKSLETKVTNAYKAADKTLETNVTKAYKAADTALESKVTKAYQAADKALEAKITNATKADKELESKLSKAYQAADKTLETKVTNAYKSADTAITKAYQAADKTLETNVTKAYKAADTALETKLNKSISSKANKATTLKGYGITDAYTKSEIDNKLKSASKYTVSDENIRELKNKTQNISEDTTEGNTIVNGDVEILGNITAKYAEFAQGASFANDSVRISSDGIVRFGGSGKTSNVTIYSTGSTSIDAKGAVVAGSIVSKGQVEASGNIVTTSGDVKAGNVSLKETAQALEGKADKATTLKGYGITDAYTKAEVDSKLDGKVDAKDVYSKTDVDNKIANVSSAIDGKVDKTYVDSNFAKTSDVYTKEEADATFVKRTELATIDENGNVIAVSTKTELNKNFVLEESDNGTEISINKGTDSQIIIGSDGSMLFGTNSTQIDENGVFAGRIEMGENDPHNYKNAQAAINQDGYIKGAGGKFEVNGKDGSLKAADGNFKVDADGNVTAATFNGINVEDAVTGLNQRLGKISGKLNKVGAGAAALAALHPLEYDPDDKLTFSAGVGNYAGENAAAIGAFYRPDEKLMFSFGGALGNGENMVNMGVSIGLDGAKGGPRLSKKELIQIVGHMATENEAIKAENQALEDRIEKLEALVAELAKKK